MRSLRKYQKKDTHSNSTIALALSYLHIGLIPSLKLLIPSILQDADSLQNLLVMISGASVGSIFSFALHISLFSFILLFGFHHSSNNDVYCHS